MKLALNNTTIEKYFGFLIRLDNLSKKRLIIKLTESIDENENDKLDLKTMYGSWEDARTSDEIISDLKFSRIEKSNPIDL
jgi:hypothetical protein